MKKTIILICVIGIFLVGGCEKKQSSIQNVNTEETTRNISNQEKDTNNSDDNFEVNKVVFEDEIIQLTCKKITNSSIKFEVMNKTDFEISWLNIDEYDTENVNLKSYYSYNKNATFFELTPENSGILELTFSDDSGIARVVNNTYQYTTVDGTIIDGTFSSPYEVKVI